jgi:DUF1680 family protein
VKVEISRRTFLATAAASCITPAVAQAMPIGDGLLSFSKSAPDSTGVSDAAWHDAGVANFSRSPFARLKPLPVRAVTIEDGFWSRRRKTNAASSIPTMHDQLVAHGRIDNFLRLEGKSQEPQKGPVYSDSDIYKWLEAAAFVLQSGQQPELKKTADAMIHDVVAAQEPGGYLNTYFVEDRKPLRMLYPTQTTGHELYNIGHMLQGAIAYYRATGDSALLDAGTRFIDDFLIPNYGPGAAQKGIVAGHPEIEMALIELYRTTGKRKYVDLAGYILHGDDRIPLSPSQISYMFCGVPFTSRTHLEGHAVRAMYACCGATDFYLETGDPAYWQALTRLWDDLTSHQLYITGGVGARQEGEAFGDAYELPNARAYGESCAAIGSMMWNWRMLAASGDSKFTDVIERALYNGINSGMSLDGTTYCYRNPLAFDPAGDSRYAEDPEGKIRNPWYYTTCCPPNLERTFASLPGYFYSTSEDGVYVHLYDNSALTWRLQDGSALRMEQKTNYPWDGDVHISVDPEESRDFAVYVRIPGWSRTNGVAVNGKPVTGVAPGKYLPIRRRWSKGDAIHLQFDMATQLVKANPEVVEDRGRVAFQRGPLVFCMEMLDQPDEVRQNGLSSCIAAVSSSTEARFVDDLLGGVMVLEHPGYLDRASAGDSLYSVVENAVHAEETRTTLRLIPYYAWANRSRTAMQVWIPYTRV